MKLYNKIFAVIGFTMIAAIFGSCNFGASAAFEDLSITYKHYTTEDKNTITSEDITVQGVEGSGTKRLIGKFESTPAFPITLEPGANEITITYKELSKTITIYKGSQIATDTPVATPAMDSYIKKTDGSEGIYYKFGDYPQTKVDAPASISDKPADNFWYIGSDGKYYDIIGEDYYAVEPIVWRLLTDDYDIDGHTEGDWASCTNKGSLLIAVNALDGVDYYDSLEARTIDEKQILASNYKYSKLRAFLNGYSYKNDSAEEVLTFKEKGFANKAFSAAALEKIVTTVVRNDGDSTDDPYHNGTWTRGDQKTGIAYSNDAAVDNYFNRTYEEYTKYPITVCENTNDKVFALSLRETAEKSYGFECPNNLNNDPAKKFLPTEYASAIDSGTASWWTRTPHYNPLRVRLVIDGYSYQSNTKNVPYPVAGVVPAIVLKLSD